LIGVAVQYVRLTKGLADSGSLIPAEELGTAVKDHNSDYYRSVFKYSQKQYEEFLKSKTVAGVVDVTTNSVVFDFDSKEEPDQARKDTVELVSRLMGFGITKDQILTSFSGNKGYSVELETIHSFTPSQLKNLAKNLAKGLKTLDTKIYNASRIFRLPYTKHPVTGLFKLPITVEQLSELSTDQIKVLAKDLSNAADPGSGDVSLPDAIVAMISQEPSDDIETLPELGELDLSLKPRAMPACKYAILHGFFPSGSRNNALMALAAHYKAQGTPKEVTHRILKGAAELQGRRYNQAAFDSNEIWKNIISTIYSTTWKGATYSCAEHDWLKAICPNKGQCAGKNKKQFVTIDAVSDVFSNYAKNIDKNTIKTGIKSIDDNIRLQTHSHVVIAGCSGSGKTSTILNILNNASNAGLKAVMGSMDMGAPLIYQKLAQKVTNLNDKALYEIFKSDNHGKIKKIRELVFKEYENVFFDFRSGIEISELRENLLEMKMRHGDELKLVVYDFINRIRGPYSDETANLSYIAPKLSDLANETETLIISLAQIARAKGGPSTPLTDSRVAKGSSAIEESATALFGIWRPGYNKGDMDKFLRMAALKTRMGKEFSVALGWDGLTGNLRELTGEEEVDLEYIETEDKEPKGDGWSS
jgi:KaiC/GvpD/RAD55 family RecA-like ATPase